MSHDDDPQACDLDGDDEGAELVACPNCGGEVFEFAQQCPHCGDWIVAGAGAGRRSPLFVAIAVVVLILVLLWFW